MPSKPLIPSDRAVVSGQTVRMSNQVVRVGGAHLADGEDAAGDGHGEPKLELIRLGDRIQAIDVICGCGQRTRIRCVYE